MSSEIRFHLDESVNPDIAQALRRQGIDVTTTAEAGLRTTDDPTQFEFCQGQGRVLITHDDDFLRLAAKHPDHCGIIYAKMRNHSLGKIILDCISLHNNFRTNDMRGRVEYI